MDGWPDEEKRRIRLVKGHIWFGLHAHLPGPFTYVTVLRDPVERVASLYHYIRNTHRHFAKERIADLSLSEFARSEFSRSLTSELANHQTRVIAGWERTRAESPAMLEQARENIVNHFAVAGVHERFDEALVLLRRRLGLRSVVHVPLNVGDSEKHGPPTSSDVEAILERNELDGQLYRFVRDRFGDAVAAEDPGDFAAELARFRRRQAQLTAIAAPTRPVVRAAENVARRLPWLKKWYLG